MYHRRSSRRRAAFCHVGNVIFQYYVEQHFCKKANAVAPKRPSFRLTTGIGYGTIYGRDKESEEINHVPESVSYTHLTLPTSQYV